MRLVIQRVKHASVEIENNIKGRINHGLLILLGITNDDSLEDINWLSQKVVNLRIFNDENNVMNRSLIDVNGDILLISQFTLYAQTQKGNRPSYINAAKADIAIPLYQQMISKLQIDFNKEIQTGEFGADMKVELLNDGPVTIIMDSKNKTIF
ncbi:MAG: D-aminoacyl-tRNA deacylase [bacterium]|jgi:D-tyrosyl-tRNA(Tyr) deacylase